jgi:ribonuclease HII
MATSSGRTDLFEWVGVDEAGRGPLAGPVVAAAVLLPEGFDVRGINDSKALTGPQREAAFDRIVMGAVWSIGIASVEEIDDVNILQATLNAMRRALSGVTTPCSGAIIDGNRAPSNIEVPVRLCIGGDRTHPQVSAASIVAKVYRDWLMTKHAAEYPGYGFATNFGYATPEHQSALREFGATPIHRTTFAPVREAIEQPCLDFVR